MAFLCVWLVGWLVSGARTFVIWHHSLIHSSDFAPLINSQLVLVSSAKVKAFYAIDNKVNQFDNNIKIDFSYNLIKYVTSRMLEK